MRGALCGDLSGLIKAGLVCLGFVDISWTVPVPCVLGMCPCASPVTHSLLVRLVLEVFNFLFSDFLITSLIFIFNTCLEMSYVAHAVIHLAGDCIVCLQVQM